MTIYICRIKILGMPFATANKAVAVDWEKQDETHYYETMELEDK